METNSQQFKSFMKFYKCNTKEQLFSEMSNCLETDVNESNYLDYIDEFQQCYESWVKFHAE